MGIFSSKKNTTTFEPMLTDDQKKAMSLLTQFGSTGKLGDFQAGQGYDFSGFNFGLNPTELAGGSALEKLMASGTGLDPARKAYEGVLGQTFNPDDPSNEFAAFNRQLTKATKDASDVLNREAAMTGGRFGTGIQKQKTELASNVADIQASKLAELYTQLQNRKMTAASGLTSLAGLEESMNQSRIQAAYQYGQQQREIENEKANMEYQDWQRARDERLSSISGLSNVMNKNVEWGQKSITTKSPGIGMKMFGTISPIIGEYNTQQYGYTTNQSNMKEGVSALMKLMGGL